ncbi:MAG TPA: EthD domain-containing protein [Pseudolysinimonas sp.]|nr:EthD domain-containing protein [Pseudolysinimonas sp.]
MTGLEQADHGGIAVGPRRRVLLVSFAPDDEAVADAMTALAAHLETAALASGLRDHTIAAFHATGGYRPDPSRPQRFVPAAAGVQLDYEPGTEQEVIALVRGIEVPVAAGDVAVSAGRVVTCLEPAPGAYLLLLGAQRKPGMTPEEFGRYWSQTHAPHAVGDLRAAPVPIGYELFLVDHDLSAQMATGRCLASRVDGWMHMTTLGPSDLAGVIRDPAHSAWVLQDEVNFVDFAAPLVGQQMHLLSSDSHPTTK